MARAWFTRNFHGQNQDAAHQVALWLAVHIAAPGILAVKGGLQLHMRESGPRETRRRRPKPPSQIHDCELGTIKIAEPSNSDLSQLKGAIHYIDPAP